MSIQKKPWNFLIYHFTLRNSGENMLSPLEILQDCVTTLAKNQDLWKFHEFFFNTTPGKSNFFN